MRLKIREVAERVGVKNASHLRTLTGLGTGTCYQIWDGMLTRIDLETLNTICNKLQVGPAMLFEYTPDVGGGPGGGDEPIKPVVPLPARTARPARKSARKARSAEAGRG